VVSDIIEVVSGNDIIEDHSSFVAEATKDVESAESCHETLVAACSGGDVSVLHRAGRELRKRPHRVRLRQPFVARQLRAQTS